MIHLILDGGLNAEPCLAYYRRLRQGVPHPEILGITTALSTIALWAVGDTSLADLVAQAPVIFGGLGLAALGAKVNDASQPAPQIIKSTKTK